jgi:hypothetical protein
MKIVPLILKTAALISLATQLAACSGESTQITEQMPVGTADLVAGHSYRLVNMRNDKVAAQGGGATGANVTTAAISAAIGQQWRAQDTGNMTFHLVNDASQRALAAATPTNQPGTNVVEADLDNSDMQKWTARKGPGGDHQIVNVASQLCLDTAFGSTQAGAALQLWPCAQSAEMNWRLVAAGQDASAAPSAPSAPTNAAAPSAGATPAAAATAGNGGYSVAQLKADIGTVLQLHAPVYSNRNLGNPANVALWTPDKIASLYRGIATAQQFFPQLSMTDLAHLVAAEGAQESTGNFALPGYSVGFLQVTPNTVVQDFTNHGRPILAPDGSAVVTPGITADLTDPAQNVALWAWYTHNVVVAGMSLNEVALGFKQGGVTPDFGNAQFDWLAGPHNDRHNPAVAASYKDYHDRIKDYFVQANFGTDAQFEQLLGTSIGTGLIDTH